MITSNVIHRIFRIRYDNNEATAFTIEYEKKEYLVTAKHLVENITDSANMELFSNGAWIQLMVKLIGHSAGGTDISVLATDKLLTPPGLPLPPTHEGLIYGQDVYFLGFPYGFLGKYSFGPEGYPLPFVKKATLSFLDNPTLLLDGHNNPGFSGGPVVFVKSGTNEFRVGAVISGYKAIETPIFENGKKSNLTYQYNTGIIVSFEINLAIELIKANSIGCVIQ